MNGDYLAPPARPSDDALTFAAFLDAWPGLVAAAMLLTGMTSIRGTLDTIFESMLIWFEPRELLAQDPANLLLSLVMPLAYLGPGLGRLWLRDWDGIFKYFGMRLFALGAAVVCFVAFVFLFFGSGSNTAVGLTIYASVLLLFAPMGIGLASAWDLLASRTV